MRTPKDNNNEYERRLQEDPYEKQGFDERLKRQIERRIERERRWSLRWLGPVTRLAVVGGVFLLALQVDWGNHQGAHQPPLQAAAPVLANEKVEILSNSSTPQPASRAFFHSALLVGFRTDSAEPESDDSTYRTILIAPVHDKLQVTAQGSGILVPYGMEFWEIDPIAKERNADRYEFLTAKPAIEAVDRDSIRSSAAGTTLVHTEKLLFAGNKYVSILSRDPADGMTETWVKTLPQLNDAEPSAVASDTADPPHVSYLAAMHDNQKAGEGRTASAFAGDAERWAIIRSQGAWTVSGLSDGANPEPLPAGSDDGEHLPDRIVSHDTLTSTWQEIAAVRPDARDAVSAPTGEWIAILTDRDLYVYAVGTHGVILGQPLLTVPLKSGETMVMAQWATNAYIAKWIQKAEMYLH